MYGSILEIFNFLDFEILICLPFTKFNLYFIHFRIIKIYCFFDKMIYIFKIYYCGEFIMRRYIIMIYFLINNNDIFPD